MNIKINFIKYLTQSSRNKDTLLLQTQCNSFQILNRRGKQHKLKERGYFLEIKATMVKNNTL